MYAVILAAGSGVRLRPLGAGEEPAAFREFTDGRTRLQRVAEQLQPLIDPMDVAVVANRRQGQLVREQLPDARIVSQPRDRGTAAALALAIVSLERPPSETVVVLSADHDVDNDQALRAAIAAADQALGEGTLGVERPIVVFAVPPTSADRELTYVQPDQNSGIRMGGLRVFRTDRLEARPEQTRARQLYESGTTYWCSGVYLATRSALAEAIERYTPLFTLLRPAFQSELALSAAYDRLQPISIEEGILVGAARDGTLLTVPLDVGRHQPVDDEHAVLSERPGRR